MTIQDLQQDARARLTRLEASLPTKSHEGSSVMHWGQGKSAIGTYVIAARNSAGEIRFTTHTTRATGR